MGTCLGHCLSTNPRRHDKCHSLYCSKTEYVQFDVVRDNKKTIKRRLCIPHSLPSLFSLKRQKEPQGNVSLELVEHSCPLQYYDRYVPQTWLPQCHHIETSGISSELEFQPLDAKALLQPQTYAGFTLAQENKSLNSTPPSSLDLEWEHEAATFHHRMLRDEEEDSDSAAASLNNSLRSRPHYKLIHSHRSRLGSRQGSITQDSSTGSKEGSRMTTPDSLEWDFVDSSIPTIDQETEQLIAEIERLAANALQETGNYSQDLNEDTLPDNEES